MIVRRDGADQVIAVRRLGILESVPVVESIESS